MNKTTILLLLMFSGLLQSQTFEWVKTPEINLSLNPDFVGYNLATNSNGDVFLMGFQDNAVSHIDILGDLFFIKYSNNGSVLFQKTITGTTQVYEMTVDLEGNLIVAMSYLSGLSIGNLNLVNQGQSEKFVVIKFNPNGDVLWHHVIPQDDLSYFRAVAVSSLNEIYIGFGNFMLSQIQKFSPSGVLLSTINQPNVNVLSSVDVDSDGNIYATGSCIGFDASFNGTPYFTDLDYNIYLVKYNASGQMQWVKILPEVTCHFPKLKVAHDDTIYFVSNLQDQHLFDSIQSEGPMNDSEDFFLAKLNGQGAYLWVQEVPGLGSFGLGNRNFLEVDNQGNAYVSGATKGQINWSESIMSQSTGIHPDGIAVKFSSQGDFEWVITGGGGFLDRFDGVSVSSAGDVFVSGMAYGNSQFGNIQLTPANSESFFPVLAKINHPALSLDEPNLEWVKWYPNPVKDLIFLENLPSIGKIEVLTMLGQNIHSVEVSNYQMSLDLGHLSSGFYILKCNQVVLGKFFKLH